MLLILLLHKYLKYLMLLIIFVPHILFNSSGNFNFNFDSELYTLKMHALEIL